MPPNGSVSLFRNVRNLNIGGGIIQNTPVTTVYNVVRQRPAGEDLDVLRSVLHSGVKVQSIAPSTVTSTRTAIVSLLSTDMSIAPTFAWVIFCSLF